MKTFLRLIRAKHYIKNVLIFVPLFFSKGIFEWQLLWLAVVGFIIFSLLSSAVYIINDLADIAKDRVHPKKKLRPIASGDISMGRAVEIVFLFLIAGLIISYFFTECKGIYLLITYCVLNVLYSKGLKNFAVLDIFILASGFVLRVLYGGILVDVAISKWLYLVIVAGALYMGLGKRRNEMKEKANTRAVLKFYTENFLDRNMYVCMAMVDVFYALWTINSLDSRLAWTVPVFIMILMRYSLNVESDSDGDPVEVLLQDQVLQILVMLYVGLLLIMLYIY